MSTALLAATTPLNTQHLKTQLLADTGIQKLFSKLDADHQLVGAGVVYISKDLTPVRLCKFKPVCRIKPIHIVIHEVPPGQHTNNYALKIGQNGRESKLVGESVAAVLSCSAAVLGWIVVLGGAGAAPVSGGLSTSVTILAYSAATASTIQCLNSSVRATSEAGTGEISDYLDSLEWYDEVSKALDIISLAGAGAATLASFKAYQVARTASSRSVMEILKGMTRAERKRITEEIIRVNHPGVSNTVLKSMILSGAYPARYSAKTINTALMLHVKDAIGATFSFTGSATSGVARDLVIGVYESTQ